MSQALLHAGEDGFIVLCIDVDDAVRYKPGLSKSRGKQVLPGHAPEHLPARSRCDPGAEKSCRGSVYGPVASAGDLVKRAKSEASTWKAFVEVT